MKPVLITGGCGYIGSHVTRKLSEQGCPLVVLDDFSNGVAEALIHHENLIVGNFGDPLLLEKIFSQFSFETVFHFAGSILVPESMEQPLKYYQNNVSNSLTLIENCVKYGVKNFIFSSSGSVYGENYSIPIPEIAELHPSNPYSRSKAAIELVLQDTAKTTSLQYGILRYFNVAGADPLLRMGQRGKTSSHLIKILAEVVLGKREELFIHGDDYLTVDGTGVRDYIHVEDLAEAHLSILNYLNSEHDSLTVNCGYGKGYSVKQILLAAQELYRDIPVTIGPRRPGDVASLIADSRLIKNVLDWNPKYPYIQKMIEHAVEWERKLAETGVNSSTT